MNRSTHSAAHTRRHQKKSQQARPHGWSRRDDGPGGMAPANHAARDRRATGIPLLMLTVLGVLTFVGVARVHSRARVLELGDEIAQLTEEQDALIDRKRRLQTERAYLRHPDRIRTIALEELGMVPTPPERIQPIALVGTAPTEEAPPRDGAPEDQP